MMTENYISILCVPNSLELEANVKLRLKGISTRQNSGRIPTSKYIGMFAGVTKPKPFQRKRASLTTDPSEVLPPLEDMRALALDSYRGSGKPFHSDYSARRELAIEHIYDGICTFQVYNISGPFDTRTTQDSAVCLGELGVTYFTSKISQNIAFKGSYDEIESWEIRDNVKAQPRDNGLFLTMKGSGAEISIQLKPGPQFPTLLHLRFAFEFFWNQHLLNSGESALPHTSHGRAVERVFTLQVS